MPLGITEKRFFHADFGLQIPLNGCFDSSYGPVDVLRHGHPGCLS
jgi:hypothetical protein